MPSALLQSATHVGPKIGDQLIAVIEIDGISWCSALPDSAEAAAKINTVALQIVERAKWQAPEMA